jgi:hypothetical protein
MTLRKWSQEQRGIPKTAPIPVSAKLFLRVDFVLSKKNVGSASSRNPYKVFSVTARRTA